MRFQAQPLLKKFFRVHRFHRWLAFSLPPWWENSQLKKLEGRFRERITTLLRIMSLFYHLILPKQIEMASLLFIQSELQFILEKKMARKGGGGGGRTFLWIPCPDYRSDWSVSWIIIKHEKKRTNEWRHKEMKAGKILKKFGSNCSPS